MTRPIVFLTDYGRSDAFVGICHGVMARIAPDSRVIDIAHSVPRQDVCGEPSSWPVPSRTCRRTRSTSRWSIAVGSDRRAVATAAGASTPRRSGQRRVILAWEALGGVEAAVEIENPAVLLMPVSRTFHGRDVFAPPPLISRPGCSSGRRSRGRRRTASNVWTCRVRWWRKVPWAPASRRPTASGTCS